MNMFDVEDDNWNKQLNDWFDSPEGQKSVKNFVEKLSGEIDRENREKERFAVRVRSMSEYEQDLWMKKIIEYYNSDKYLARWTKRGMFPPNYLFNKIREFIFDNGVKVGETEDGCEIYQYNHWKMDCIYGQGECHHNFVYTIDTPHRYGANIYYVIRHHRRKIHMLDNLIFKSWNDAKLVVDGFIGSCKSKGIQDVLADEFEIVEVTIGNPSDVVKQIDYLVKTTPIF